VGREQRAIHKQKLANETIRSEIQEYETQNAALSDQINEDLQALVIQRTNKPSVLHVELQAEDAKKGRLQDEVSRLGSESGGLFK
jgi:hypothetical protein